MMAAFSFRLTRLSVLLFFAGSLLWASPIEAQTAGCQYILGFATLAAAVPQVGQCTDNQAFAANGDALQHTSGGLLVWRKADNWTAFTDGYRTWINGPNGVQQRLNGERFPWEAAAPNQPAAGLQPCAYTQMPRDYFYCTSGPSVTVQLAPYTSKNYVFNYSAHFMWAGALQAVNPTIFFTVAVTPVDQATTTSVGINIYDGESLAAAAVADQYGIMHAGNPQSTSTLASSVLQDHPNTIRGIYSSGKDGLVRVQLFNNASEAVSLTLDQSGLMWQRFQVASVVLQPQ